jgi:hypothetical protein
MRATDSMFKSTRIHSRLSFPILFIRARVLSMSLLLHSFSDRTCLKEEAPPRKKEVWIQYVLSCVPSIEVNLPCRHEWATAARCSVSISQPVVEKGGQPASERERSSRSSKALCERSCVIWWFALVPGCEMSHYQLVAPWSLKMNFPIL